MCLNPGISTMFIQGSQISPNFSKASVPTACILSYSTIRETLSSTSWKKRSLCFHLEAMCILAAIQIAWINLWARYLVPG
ncbi:hypothetical protein GDO78_014879 [Eleutherodactylus coqui]|uniref:Uncharacterized protein n=1 Tax=Eleutherodactylus coqui TaxID=57060 RepID=A0A8J6JX43_ELECQ|nr:hypothetical protein GDO78_014879 [Eleutherodactylus coqui]